MKKLEKCSQYDCENPPEYGRDDNHKDQLCAECFKGLRAKYGYAFSRKWFKLE